MAPKVFLSLLFIFYLSFTVASQTLVLQPNGVKGKDAVLTEGLVAPNPKSKGFIAGVWTQNGNPYSVKSVIQFDYSSLPAGSEIVAARLSLFTDTVYAYFAGVGHSTDNAWYIKRLLSPWEENTVTWYNAPVIDNSTYISMPASTSPLQNYLDIDVTTFVKDELAYPQKYFGFIIGMQEEMPHRNVSFASSDHPIAGLHPMLTLELRPLVPTIHNVITPNNDNKNEHFEVVFSRPVENVEVSVYNRWGEKLFHSSNYKNDWNGGDLPDGSYYYHIKAGDATYNGVLWINR